MLKEKLDKHARRLQRIIKKLKRKNYYLEREGRVLKGFVGDYQGQNRFLKGFVLIILFFIRLISC